LEATAQSQKHFELVFIRKTSVTPPSHYESAKKSQEQKFQELILEGDIYIACIVLHNYVYTHNL
jgi:hypothetical protein